MQLDNALVEFYLCFRFYVDIKIMIIGMGLVFTSSTWLAQKRLKH